MKPDSHRADRTMGAGWRFGLVLAAAAMAGEPLLAKDTPSDQNKPPETYTRLVECRALPDPAQRLACFDERSQQLQVAEQRGDIVMFDRASMQEAKKGLFGLSLPRIKLFGSGGESDIKEITGTIESAAQYDYGRWRMTLADGSVWDQIDTEVLPLDPRKGNAIVISRASMGGFKASVNRQAPIRVRRVK